MKIFQYTIMIMFCMLTSMVILVSDMILDLKKPIEELFRLAVFIQYLVELTAVLFARIGLLVKYKIDMGCC